MLWSRDVGVSRDMGVSRDESRLYRRWSSEGQRCDGAGIGGC